MSRSALRLLSSLTLLALLCTACTPPATPSASPLPADTLSGRLVLYSGRAEPLVKPILDLFKDQHPNVEVVLTSGSNNEMAAKILEERAHPVADLLITTDQLPLQQLDSEGALVPYLSDGVKAVPAGFRDAEGAWVGLTMRARVIMYNTDLVKPEDAPKSIFDLTDPKWKGQVAAAGSTNGSMQAQIAAMIALQGEEKTQAWLAGLIANDTQFFAGHTDVRKAVGAGEFKLGLVNHYYYYLQKAEGSPVGIVWPDQGDGELGLFTNPTAIGIVQGGPNQPVAQAFVDFLLTEQAQDIFARVNYEYPIVPSVPAYESVTPLSQFKLAHVDAATLWRNLAPAQALIQTVGLP